MLALLPLCIFIHAIQVSDTTSVTLYDITDTLSPENEKYSDALETAAVAFREADALFKDDSFIKKRDWKLEIESDEGDLVYSKMTPRGKMVTVSTTLPAEVNYVMNDTWTGVARLPEWNSNIKYAKTIATLSPHADIATYGNNKVLIVSARDFVSARIYRPLPTGGFLFASKSVELPEYPEQSGKIRANLFLGGALFRADPAAPTERTLCDVIMVADIRGMLPKFLVNRVLPRLMLMDAEENKKHFRKLTGKPEE